MPCSVVFLLLKLYTSSFSIFLLFSLKNAPRPSRKHDFECWMVAKSRKKSPLALQLDRKIPFGASMLPSKNSKIHCKNVYFLLMTLPGRAFHVSSSVPFMLAMCKTLFSTEIWSLFKKMLPACMGSMILKIDPQDFASKISLFGPMMPLISNGWNHFFNRVRSLGHSVLLFRLMSPIWAVRDVAKSPTKMCISCLWTRLSRTQSDTTCIQHANQRPYAQSNPKITPECSKVTLKWPESASKCPKMLQSDPWVTPKYLQVTLKSPKVTAS